MSAEIHYQLGVPESLRAEAAELYDAAFGQKFSVAVSDHAQRLKLLRDSFALAFAYAAIADGRLAGLAGFQTPAGSLTHGISAEELFQHLGVLRGVRAAAVFSLFDRKPSSGELLMDGIAVRADMRGHGIGTRLLACLHDYAVEHGFKTIRLDVIDTNAAARRLYERRGFVATRTEKFEYLRWMLGFGASTTMELRITDDR
ncbi:MAG: GNAT family N-acetyltransferase [Pseudomonadota bacterium]